jgi:hypothetical protein
MGRKRKPTRLLRSSTMRRTVRVADPSLAAAGFAMAWTMITSGLRATLISAKFLMEASACDQWSIAARIVIRDLAAIDRQKASLRDCRGSGLHIRAKGIGGNQSARCGLMADVNRPKGVPETEPPEESS